MVRKPRKTGRRWVENGPLEGWMRQYARWLAGEPGAEITGSGPGYRARHPMGEVRAARASFFAHRTVQAELVRRLEKRDDFRAYFGRLREDTQFHAKELARDQITENFAIREAGLRKAAGRKVDTETGEVTYDVQDHKVIEHYTRPFVELAFPKKVDAEKTPPRVTINLIGARPEDKRLILQALTEEEEPQDIEYEIVPNERLLTDGEDE